MGPEPAAIFTDGVGERHVSANGSAYDHPATALSTSRERIAVTNSFRGGRRQDTKRSRLSPSSTPNLTPTTVQIVPLASKPNAS